MSYMEIVVLPQNVLRIKGKQNSLYVNPTEKQSATVAIIIGAGERPKFSEDTVVIDGAGEYEVGGMRISGVRTGDDVVYSMIVDGVDVLLGTLTGLENGQSKIKEHSVVVVLAQTVREASFVTSYASNALIFYGDKSEEIVSSLEKEGVHTLAKYQTALDKLPAEMEIVRLA